MSKTNPRKLKIHATKIWTILFIVLFLGLTNVAQATLFTGNADSKWSNPANWAGNQVPSPGGSAEITDKMVLLDVDVTIATVTLSGTGNGGTIYSVGGNLTITSRLEIATRGTLTQPMTVTISSGATLAFTGPTPFSKNVTGGVIINNAGRVEWSGGPVYFDGVLNNNGLFAISADAGFGSANRSGVINNNASGRIEKTTGAGLTQFAGFTPETNQIDTRINNKGVVAVASGTMEIGSGTSDGEFLIGAGKTLIVRYAHTFDGAMFTDTGTCQFMAIMTLLGHIDSEANLELMPSGRIVGGDSVQPEAFLDGNGLFTWKGGHLNGTLTIGQEVRTILTGGDSKIYDGAITNKGTMDWTGPGAMVSGASTFRNEGTFNVLAAGLFLADTGSSRPTFENIGTLNTFPDGTSTTDDTLILNSGVVNIGGYGHAGILNVNSYTQTATGTLYMEIGGVNGATPQFDQLGGGIKMIEGKLNVSLINNFNPPKDARFTLINSQAGTFTKVELPGANRFAIEYPGNNKTELVSLSDVPLPPLLWAAGRDLLRNESPDNATESEAINHTTPQWTYGYRAAGQGIGEITAFAPQEHFNDGSGLHGWIRSDTATLGVNTKNTPIIFNSGSGNYAPLLSSQIYMNPGNDGRPMIVRWTAPESGNYRVLAEFLDLDGNGGDGITFYFVVNGFLEAQDTLKSTPDYFEDAKIRASTFHVNAGSNIEFMITPGLDKSFDATAFNAIIRRVPEVKITSPAYGEQFNGGAQNVTFNVTVENVIQAAKVSLTIDGANSVVTDTTAPFSLTALLQPGPHWITAVAIDADGAAVESPGIPVIVAPPSAQPAATKLEKKGGDSSFTATASNPGKLFISSQSGSWNDPATWGNQGGVPLRWDYAIIQNGHHVTLDLEIDVRGVTVDGTLSTAPGASVQYGLFVYGNLFLSGRIENLDLFINGPAGKLLILGPPSVLRSVNIVNQSSMIITASQFDAQNVTIENRGSIKAGPPIGSQGPLNLNLTTYSQTGGATILGANTVLTVQPGVQLTGLLQLSPGYLIGLDGGTLVGNDGGTLVGNDGGTLIGLDGGTLIGDASSTLLSDGGGGLVGNDGGTLVGPNGAPLVGNDGGTLISRPGPTNQSRGPTSPEATFGDILLNGGTVIGIGELRGNVINQSAVIMPGNSAGGIVVTGNYTQQAGGTLVLEKGGKTFAPFTYDIFQVTGAANLGGSLVVKTIDGYTPTSGDSVAPLLYGSHTGNFASVTSNAQVTLGAKAGTVNVTGENPPTPKALNIATRMKVETGDNALIAGFIITGSSPKKVIIRGIGPSLPFAGVLADPTLSLDGGAMTNDNWRSNQEQEIIATTIPPSHNLEAAIVATLSPGAHTAILRGAGNATGIGVVEVYDLESGTPVQLANISSRGFVQAGDNVMIGGFIIGGTYSTKVIVRAIGPSLTVSGKLADPTLELVDQNGGRISNDNWRETQEAEIIATTIPPSHDNESAIVATLAPGSYTAIVRGKDDTTGIAVVEAYNLQ